MFRLLCLIAGVVGGGMASPQTYGLPPPGPPPSSFSKQTFVLQSSPTPTVLSDFTSQTGQFRNNFQNNIFQTFPRNQFTNPNFQSGLFNPTSQNTQTINPNFQTNPAFQRNQPINQHFQTSTVLNDFSQPQVSNPIPQTNLFNRPPVRSGIENHPFLHGNTLELLPPLQHVVGTKYPRVEAGPGFRFPTSQLLNTTPPPNLLA